MAPLELAFKFRLIAAEVEEGIDRVREGSLQAMFFLDPCIYPVVVRSVPIDAAGYDPIVRQVADVRLQQKLAGLFAWPSPERHRAAGEVGVDGGNGAIASAAGNR